MDIHSIQNYTVCISNISRLQTGTNGLNSV